MKLLSYAALFLSVATYTSAFVPLMRTTRNPSLSHVALSMVEEAQVGSDISVPYDAAARLAYDNWRAEYNKGDFDPNRYLNFKNNYETITVANVVAKKRARDEGTVSLSLMTLNEFGDLSESEYKSAMEIDGSTPSSTAVPTSTGDVLSKALEAAELQVQASTALGEAADALAEEEQKLMEMLGLESLEELEIALDSLEGIAPDGGELETENIAREARIRDAYLKWCKEYRKEPDESRFQTFSNNFLMLEQYAKESAKEMTLNQYADFTKEEYEALQSGVAPPSPTSASSSTSTNGAMETSAAPKTLSGIEKILATAAKAAQSAKESFESSLKSASTAAKSVELNVDRDELVETATSGLEKVMELAAKSIDAGLQAIPLDEKEPETEEERAEREARIKALEEERIEAEKRAAAARAQRAAELAKRAEEEAARRKTIEEERAAREKMMAAEAAKAKVAAEKATIEAAKAAAEREAARAAERAKIEAKAANELREKARIWEEQQRKLNAKRIKVVVPQKKGWTLPFPSSASSTNKATVVKNATVKKVAAPVKKVSAPASPAFSLFAAPTPTPKKTITAPKKVVTAPKKEISPPSSPFSFFPTPSTTTAKTPSQPKRVVTSSPSFSLFSITTPKATVTKVTPAPAPAAASPKPQPFSFFGSSEKPKTVVKTGSNSLLKSPQVAKKDVKVPNRSGTISILGGKKEQEKPVAKTFTLFNSPKTEAPPVKKEASGPTPSTFSFFGPSSSSNKSAPAVKKPDIKVPNRPGTLSIFGNSKPSAAKSSPPPNVPILSQWRQNADGSIVGKVSNSNNFRPGTEITTSPVKKGATSGSVVTTGSGSKYYLN